MIILIINVIIMIILKAMEKCLGEIETVWFDNIIYSIDYHSHY